MSLISKVVSCSFLLFTLSSNAEIRSSVSPEFPHGLHSLYLGYIAEKMKMKLDIQPMPLARRIKQFESGKLDILVGLIKRRETNPNFVYLEPGYERLSSSFFVLKKNQHKLSNRSELANFVIGVTIGSKYFSEFETRQDITKVEVNTLQQKIGLLHKGRIGAFLHYRQSTLSKLSKTDLRQEIVLADYQPDVFDSHHFVINKNSRLYPVKDKLEQVIALGLKNGDFQTIRKKYYDAKKR